MSRKRTISVARTPFAVLEYLKSKLEPAEYSGVQECMFEYDDQKMTIETQKTRHMSEAFLHSKCTALIFSDLHAVISEFYEYRRGIDRLCEICQLLCSLTPVVDVSASPGVVSDADTVSVKIQKAKQQVRAIEKRYELDIIATREEVIRTHSHCKFSVQYPDLSCIMGLSRDENDEDNILHFGQRRVEKLVDETVKSVTIYTSTRNICLLGAVVKYRKRKEAEFSEFKRGGYSSVSAMRQVQKDIFEDFEKVVRKTKLSHELENDFAHVYRINRAEVQILQEELARVSQRVDDLKILV